MFPSASSKTWTLDGDFDEGVLLNLNHDPNHDQLQLNARPMPLPAPVITATFPSIDLLNVVNMRYSLNQFSRVCPSPAGESNRLICQFFTERPP